MLRSILVSCAVLAAAPSAADAQRPNHRRGLWVGLGAGAGSAKATCSVCLDRETGVAAQARVGGTISRSVLAGAEGSGWLKSGAQVDRAFLMLAAVGTFYPSREHGLHLKAGLGQYWYVEEDRQTELSSQGLAVQLGAGYDIRVTPGVSLSPFATLIRSGFGNPTRLDKASGFKQPLFSDMTVQFFQLGLAATLH